MASMKKSVIVLAVVTAFFIAADIAALVYTIDYLSNSEKVTGVVTDVQTVSTGTRSGYRTKNTIQYTAKNGTAYAIIEGGSGMNKGDRVEVSYDRRDPQSATASAGSTWAFNIVLTVCALAAATAAGARYAA